MNLCGDDMPDLQKKTALDDDASIYKKDRSRTEKQKWEEMDKEQRRQYFADYYLRKMLGIVAGIFAFFFSWVALFKAGGGDGLVCGGRR